MMYITTDNLQMKLIEFDVSDVVTIASFAIVIQPAWLFSEENSVTTFSAFLQINFGFLVGAPDEWDNLQV